MTKSGKKKGVEQETGFEIYDERDYGAFIPSTLDDSGIDPYEFRLYAHLSRRAGRGGNCREGIEKMAEICSMNKKTATLKLQRLAKQRMIRIQYRPGLTNQIWLCAESNWELEKNTVKVDPLLDRVEVDPLLDRVEVDPKTDRPPAKSIQKRIDGRSKSGSGVDPFLDHKGTPLKVPLLKVSSLQSESKATAEKQPGREKRGNRKNPDPGLQLELNGSTRDTETGQEEPEPAIAYTPNPESVHGPVNSLSVNDRDLPVPGQFSEKIKITQGNLRDSAWSLYNCQWHESATTFEPIFLKAAGEILSNCDAFKLPDGRRNDVMLSRHIRKLETAAQRFYGQASLDARQTLLDYWAHAEALMLAESVPVAIAQPVPEVSREEAQWGLQKMREAMNARPA